MAAEVLAVTEHLVLRQMRDDDAAALAAYRSDPVQARYQSFEAPHSVDSARALIAEMRDVRFAQPGAWLQIKDRDRRTADRRHRRPRRRDNPRQATVGFTFAADAQGRGFATEALRSVISLLFTQHGVHRIYADCHTRNDHSRAAISPVSPLSGGPQSPQLPRARVESRESS